MKMKQNIISITLIIFLTIVGCRKPQPDPHLNDFIYLNLKQELVATESLLNEKKTQYSEYKDKIEQADIQSSGVKVARAKAEASLNEIRKLEQKVLYWKMKLISREEAVRNSYLESFNKGLEWSNAEEVDRYKKTIDRASKRKPASK